MSIEIELKFMVKPDSVICLTQALSQWPNQQQAEQRLSNTYYETAEHFLRTHGMGLRIRRRGQHHEMTLKTEGSVIAGLHQRAEYNIDLSQTEFSQDSQQIDQQTLAQLPATIWPSDCDINQLALALQPIFSTNFLRQTWLVSYHNSQIEVALDRGEIQAGQHITPLLEIELELITGQPAELLAFAQQLVTFGGLRMSSQSKAERGYRLAQLDTPSSVTSLSVLTQSPKMSVEQAMIAAIEQAIAHWQYHEELWLVGQASAKNQILYSIAAIRQTWVTFGGLIPRKATATLRTILEQVETNVMEATEAEQAVWQNNILELKLALIRWLIERQWLTYCDKKDLVKLTGSFKRFADIMLSRNAAELKASFADKLTEQEYRDRLPRLQRLLTSLHHLSGAYSPQLRESYLASWQALCDGITAPQMVYKEALRKQALSIPPFWLHSAQKTSS